MQMRLKAISYIAIGLLSLASSSAASAVAGISDVAGDANGLNVANAELDTRPASYDPGDLREVLLTTTYKLVPVGADGRDYRATGVTIQWVATATPEIPEPPHDKVTITGAFRLATTIDGHRVNLEARLSRSGQSSTRATAEVHMVDGCIDGGECWVETGGARTAVIDPAQSGIVMRLPFSALTPRELELLAEGNVLEAPRGETLFPYRSTPIDQTGMRIDAGVLLDATPQGEDFVIGSDMPDDVTCTQDCPQT